MRLLTHNMLQCHAKPCPGNGFPLTLHINEWEEQSCEINEEFLRNISTRIDWPAFLTTLGQITFNNAELDGLKMELPTSFPEEPSSEFLKTLHVLLMETDVKEGEMVCRGCGHVYRIRDSIPNMLLSEYEV